jgi:hypothetical protein
VKVVGFEVEGERVCQQMGQAVGDLFAILLGDSDIHDFLPSLIKWADDQKRTGQTMIE